MKRWAGKVAVVTGASVGIGAAVAVALADAGMTVVAASRQLDKLQELQNKSKGRGRILPFRCDVTKEEDIHQLMDFAKINGGIHVLINNAGLLPCGSLFDYDGQVTPMSEIDENFRVNVLAVILATRLAVADMNANKRKGHIIMMNSITGNKVVNLAPVNLTSSYGSTKYALTQLAEQMRFDLNHIGGSIRMTSICPGLVDTAMCASIKNVPANSAPLLRAPDVAAAVLYALGAPEDVNITQITIQPVGEMF